MKAAVALSLSIAATVVACKRSEVPDGSQVVDAAPRPDARPRVVDGSQAPIDASRLQDAPIAGAPPIDAAPAPGAGGRRPKSRLPVDAAPVADSAPVAIDAAPLPPEPDARVAPGACHRTTFETKLVAEACEEGGQGAAKAAMKKFVRAARKQEAGLECKSCHTKLAPAYPLKDDALEHLRRLGGE